MRECVSERERESVCERVRERERERERELLRSLVPDHHRLQEVRGRVQSTRIKDIATSMRVVTEMSRSFIMIQLNAQHISDEGLSCSATSVRMSILKAPRSKLKPGDVTANNKDWTVHIGPWKVRLLRAYCESV